MKGFLYRIFPDPLLKGLRKEVIKHAGRPGKVIDIACGPGTLATGMAQHSGMVTGIDLDEDLISYASKRAERLKLTNLHFEVRDASDLSAYRDNEFDIAVTSMSVHQFEPSLAVKILSEMKRIASKVIIADYNCPMPDGFSRSVAYSAEHLAGGDHHRNFLNYMSAGGIKHFTEAAGLEVISATIRSKGVFVVVVCG